MVDSQVLFLSHGVLLVVTFLVVWLVLHDRVCSILDKIFEVVVLSIIYLDPCFSTRRVLLKKPQTKKAQKMTKKKYVVKSFYHSSNCSRVNVLYAWNTLNQYTVNSVVGDHLWCTTKWSLTGGDHLQEKSRKNPQTGLFNIIT